VLGEERRQRLANLVPRVLAKLRFSFGFIFCVLVKQNLDFSGWL
jgi:hypothetical protein